MTFTYNVYQLDFYDNKLFVTSFDNEEQAKEFVLKENKAAKFMHQVVGYFYEKESTTLKTDK